MTRMTDGFSMPPMILLAPRHFEQTSESTSRNLNQSDVVPQKDLTSLYDPVAAEGLVKSSSKSLRSGADEKMKMHHLQLKGDYPVDLI
jgi:hypothetical protein